MNKITTKFIAACALFYWAKGSFAHDMQGFSGSHWHTTDTLGFVAVAGLAAAAIWLSRK